MLKPRTLAFTALFLIWHVLSAFANDWFPKLSPDGKHVIAGAGEISLDQQPTGDIGWGPDWCSNITFIFNGSTAGLRMKAIGQGGSTQIDAREFSEISCGGGMWAGRDPNTNSLIVDDGLVIPNAGQPAVADDEFLIYRTGDDRIEPSASRGCAAWSDGRGSILGFPRPDTTVRQISVEGIAEWRPVCIDTPQGPWLLTMDHTRLMLRPFASAGLGYVIAPGNDNNLYSHGVFAEGEFRVVYNDAGGRLFRWHQPANAPLVSLRVGTTEPPPPPPPPPQQCASSGIVNNQVINLEDWFCTLRAGRPASAWDSVLTTIEPELWKYGVGQQRGSGGAVRGRLFIPHALCPNAAPVNEAEKKLGVHQNPICWEHAIDVVSEDGREWIWADRGGPEYVPLGTPTTPPPPVVNFEARIKKLEEGLVRVEQEAHNGLERLNNVVEQLQIILTELGKEIHELEQSIDPVVKAIIEGALSQLKCQISRTGPGFLGHSHGCTITK